MNRLFGWVFLIGFAISLSWIAISFLVYLPIDSNKVHPSVARIGELRSFEIVSFDDMPGLEIDFENEGISTESGTTQMGIRTPIGSTLFRLSVSERQIIRFSFWAQNWTGQDIDNDQYADSRRQLTRFLEKCPGCHPSVIMRISRDPFAISRSAVRFYIRRSFSKVGFGGI